MSSRSSSKRLPVGRVAGHRGNRGEITVRVAQGPASDWVTVPGVWIEPATGARARRYVIEATRAYANKWVLKLHGVDDATTAAEMRGATVSVEREEAPELPAGSYYHAVLTGMSVSDEQGRSLGQVDAVIPTGGVDLLRVVREGDQAPVECLIPLAPEIVLHVDETAGTILVRLPEGLEDLNRGA